MICQGQCVCVIWPSPFRLNVRGVDATSLVKEQKTKASSCQDSNCTKNNKPNTGQHEELEVNSKHDNIPVAKRTSIKSASKQVVGPTCSQQTNPASKKAFHMEHPPVEKPQRRHSAAILPTVHPMRATNAKTTSKNIALSAEVWAASPTRAACGGGSPPQCAATMGSERGRTGRTPTTGQFPAAFPSGSLHGSLVKILHWRSKTGPPNL